MAGHQIGFLTEWQLYAQKIEGDQWKGEKLDKSKIEKMSCVFPLHIMNAGQVNTAVDQQLGQLYELMQAIQRRDPGDSGT